LITVKVGNYGQATHSVVVKIDEMFINVCEPESIKAVAALPSLPLIIGAKVSGENLYVEVEGQNLINHEIEIVVRISGIRLGSKGKRFAAHSYDDMVKNNSFWRKWRDS
jgi:hypothetical protein